MSQDIEYMDRPRLKIELQQLRLAVATFLAATGNDMCHENRQALAAAARLEAPRVRPLPFWRFLFNCVRYRIGLSRRCCCKQGGKTCPSKSPA